MSTSFAPGQRIALRDAEFLVTKAFNPQYATTSFGKQGALVAHVVECIGTSDLVRDRPFKFDLAIDAYKVVRPEDTVLVADTTPRYDLTRLLIESQLRLADVSHREIALADRAALDVYDYQLEPARKALQTPFARILIADAVGLGKTAEVGILLTELMRRGRGKRILVLALKSVLAQFQQELWDRFAIPLMRLDSEGVSQLRARLPSSKNPFSYYDKVIVSIDTLKKSINFQHYLERTHWDVVVIDECHNVANADSQRGDLAQLLARKCDNLIFTSATPHNGDNAKFANLMRMLEPTAAHVRPPLVRAEDLGANGSGERRADELGFDLRALRRHVIRRAKKDLPAEVQTHFSDRKLHKHEATLLPPEVAFLRWLNTYREEERRREGARLDALFSIGLLKAYLSSPVAAMQSLKRRIAVNERERESDQAFKVRKEQRLERELEVLPQGVRLLEAVFETSSFGDSRTLVLQDAKLRAFLTLLEQLKWKGTTGSDRIVLFAERIETLEYLEGAVAEHFGLDRSGTDPSRGHSITAGVARFDGSLPDVQQQEVIEDFGRKRSATRLLLTSDAGSQGVNLHYECHVMINYDLPWSLITLEQRNGRIDRYGQFETPHIHYLIAATDAPGVDSDLRIIGRIQEKEDFAYHTLGDAGAITALYDATAEERLLAVAVATGQENVLDKPANTATAITLDDLFAQAAAQQSAPKQQSTDARPSSHQTTKQPSNQITLYKTDPAFYTALLDFLTERRALPPGTLNDLGDGLYEVERNAALRDVLFGVPDDALPSKTVRLSLKPAPVMAAIERARKTDGAWTATQILYDAHPLARNWMQKVAMQLNACEAPVARLRVLPEGQAHYLFYGQSTNDLGTSLLSEFYVVPVDLKDPDSGAGRPVTLDEFWRKPELQDERQTWVSRDTDEETLALLTAQIAEVVESSTTFYLEPKLEALRQNMQRKEANYRAELDAWIGEIGTLTAEAVQGLPSTERGAWYAYQEGLKRYQRYTTMRAGTHVQLLGVVHNG